MVIFVSEKKYADYINIFPRNAALDADVISMFANVGGVASSGLSTMHGCIYGVRYTRRSPVLSGPSSMQDNVFPMHDSLNSRCRLFNNSSSL